jgi:DUF4097 and DUF4098 domain-containing protein YvlB
MGFPARVATVVAVGVASLSASACVIQVESKDYTAREERRFTVSGTPDLTLVTFDGPIEVRAWDKPEVLVEIHKSGSSKEAVDAIAVLAEQDGGRVRVEAREPSRAEWSVGGLHMTRQARLVASVPRSCNVLARSGDGSIHAERVSGRLELRTGDGSVRGLGLDGDIHVDTGDGSVKLQDVNGAVSVRTGDGSIFASGRFSALRADTEDGSISLHVARGSAMADAWDISTGHGGVVVGLPDQFGADIDASTSEGVIRVDESVGASAPPGDERRTLRAKLGPGGRVLRIRTNDGTITIRKS